MTLFKGLLSHDQNGEAVARKSADPEPESSSVSIQQSQTIAVVCLITHLDSFCTRRKNQLTFNRETLPQVATTCCAIQMQFESVTPITLWVIIDRLYFTQLVT